MGVEITAGAATAADVKRQFPDTVEGANAMINQLYKNKLKVEDAIKMAKEDGYSPEFLAVLEQEKGQDPAGVAQLVIQDTDIDVNDEEVRQIAEAKRIIGDVAGFDSKEIRAIAKELGVTPEKAAELHAAATEEIKEARKENRVSRRSGRTNNRYTGGLMSRK